MSVRYRRVDYHYTVSAVSAWSGLAARSVAPAHWRPPADIVETPQAVHLTVEIPGVDEDDLVITLFQNALVVEGLRHRPAHSAECVFHTAEIRYGAFRLEVAIHGIIQADQVEATYDRGMLVVAVPRTAAGND